MLKKFFLVFFCTSLFSPGYKNENRTLLGRNEKATYKDQAHLEQEMEEVAKNLREYLNKTTHLENNCILYSNGGYSTLSLKKDIISDWLNIRMPKKQLQIVKDLIIEPENIGILQDPDLINLYSNCLKALLLMQKQEKNLFKHKNFSLWFEDSGEKETMIYFSINYVDVFYGLSLFFKQLRSNNIKTYEASKNKKNI